MKSMSAIAILALATVSLVLGQGAKLTSQPDQIAEAIKQMDRQWIIGAYSSRDLKDFDRIVAEDFLITGANGRILNKTQKRANVAADYTEFAPDAVFKIDEQSAKVRVFGSTAISTGFIIENYMYKDMKINGRVYFTNTYLKRNGRWQVVASHFTNIKQS
jgi:hypothetical protein